MFERRYKVVRYKKIPFETYKPKPRINLSKENTMPILVRVFNRFVFLGGLVSFFASSLLISIRGFFGIRERIRSTSRMRVIKYEEIRK